jgi:hypothetical protein
VHNPVDTQRVRDLVRAVSGHFRINR